MFRFAASSMPVTLRQWGLVAMACSAVALSGCGGGDRAKAYAPDRVVTFGDENSAIESYSSVALNASGGTAKTVYGLTYSVNSVGFGDAAFCTDQTANTLCADADKRTDVTSFTKVSGNAYLLDAVNTGDTQNVVTLIDLGTGDYASLTGGPLKRTINKLFLCYNNTIWVQVVAHNFGKGYEAQCPLDRGGAENYAAYGAKVQQINDQIAANRGRLGKGVLVTLMAGQNDILEVYAAVQATTLSEASAIAELKLRAAAMARGVRDIISTGAKVALALTPDLGESPKASAGGENAALLKRLTQAFNDALYITELGNTSGRSLAGVNPEPYTNTLTRSASYVYSTAVCDPAKAIRPDGATIAGGDADASAKVKYCNGSTLVSGGDTSTYMWADDVHFAPLGHSLIGAAAATRITNQF